jgi:hypothetical protein
VGAATRRSPGAGTDGLRATAMDISERFCHGPISRMSTQLSEDVLALRIRECILELLVDRGPGRTIGLAEAAQALALRIGYHWHDLMRPVRTVAAALADAGTIEALQLESVVDIREARGPVRLRLRALPGKRSAVRS